MEKVLIIGTGCAGLTAAIYTARSDLSPLVLEGRQPGGQLTTTSDVENFPGFPEGIQGPDLIMRMHQQAEKFGARFQYGAVEDFDSRDGIHRTQIDGQWIESQTVIIATGASPRYLDLPGEQALIGHGLTSCATCDGAFYRHVPVCVIGGGDSACEEALFLTRFASQVTLIHRRDTLRASKIMAQRALSHPKINLLWNQVAIEYLVDPQGEMQGIKLQNTLTQQIEDFPTRCVFMAIGHTPNTAPFRKVLATDPAGYLLQHQGTCTSLPGVFAAGDVADPIYRQAVTAAGQGCAAALDAERWLAHRT